MEIKDYLHLYIGCEVEIKGHKNAILGAVGIDDGNRVIVRWPLENEWSYADVNEIKPILRKLSDMTEEESIELFKNVSNFDLSEYVFDIMDDEDGFTINAEQDGRVVDAMSIDVNSDIVSMMDNNGTFHPLNPQSQAFRFFLSKGFDLFNLIEAGLAIDKTSLKN